MRLFYGNLVLSAKLYLTILVKKDISQPHVMIKESEGNLTYAWLILVHDHSLSWSSVKKKDSNHCLQRKTILQCEMFKALPETYKYT